MIRHQSSASDQQKSAIIAAASQVIARIAVLYFFVYLSLINILLTPHQRNDFTAGFHDHLDFMSPGMGYDVECKSGRAIITECLLFYCTVNDLDDDSGHS